MNQDQLADCCGIIVLHHFGGGHPHSDVDACISKTACKTYLQSQEKAFYGLRGGLLAVLTTPQNDRIGSVFLERKWKLLLENHMNPRTGQRMFMYFRDLNDSPARKKRIFG